jgi:hypothetical protein
MKTTTYGDILNLAAELADRTRDNLPTSEATMLLAFFAAELPDLWNREAWPELCDNIESVTLDANDCFSLREGDADEMGDILGIFEEGDPRTSTQCIRVRDWTRLDNRVNVVATQATVYVDWQDPAPDLLAVESSALSAYTLPRRFYLSLAYKGAAHLIHAEDPQRAAQYLAMADMELAKQTARINPPWWRGARH